ncbi:MAG: N-acetyl-gamma-glutamyl-phosphate reductase [Nitrospinales bacterium]
MTKVSIAGATGYTGLELLRLLLQHPDIQINTLSSETYAGKNIAEVFPSMAGQADFVLSKLDEGIAEGCDILFLALPHTASMEKMSGFLKSDCRVIDLSADYRLHDADTFANWYKIQHKNPENINNAVYGLPELHRTEIKNSKLVANPGCYPTSVILGLAPIFNVDWVDSHGIIADCKSGISGAGRKVNLGVHYSEANEGVSAYNLAEHRHTPEIEQEISLLAGEKINISFSPHLMPMTRGMLSTIYVNLKSSIELDMALEHYQKFYKDEPFVRILAKGIYANTKFVSYSNYCDIGLQVDQRNNRMIITSAIDNLIKGASGQAIQNMNIMLGLDEKTGLNSPGIFP